MRLQAAVVLGALAASSSAFNLQTALPPVLKQNGLGSADIKTVISTGGLPGLISTFWSDWLKWVTTTYELGGFPAPQSKTFESWKTFKVDLALRQKFVLSR